jgi:hypothetical protein
MGAGEVNMAMTSDGGPPIYNTRKFSSLGLPIARRITVISRLIEKAYQSTDQRH